MHLLAVADIFGKTSAFMELLSPLDGLYESVAIIDPYDGTGYDFKSENQAYEYFTENVGLDSYIKKLINHLEKNSDKTYNVLGFSVGASAVWAASENENSSSVNRAVLFYSSQIRYFTHICPLFPVDLYFAREESKYAVDEIIKTLSIKEKVKCFKTEYLHGFMNKNSRNFDLNGFIEYTQTIKKKLHVFKNEMDL